ncbi:DUF3429 domain-containing protein [Sphingomonas hengshuiensis]|uniref:DUF3429 domain-containing protein n=1 Tax=Sphingomonas hengshuiensis TaxID=1609977 RepID=A0A7U4J9M1_9SPHN|nr:DUF3429 domain-containing protein [Sphingomonas hengshuiensis]AJP72766.1 hypothetical protein TS85_14760 [Sphingomonas hengshuiensis]
MTTPPEPLRPLGRTALWLGYAGLLPQMLGLLLFAIDGEMRWVVPAAGLFYAALIFSFVGGAWWGAAVASGREAPWLFVVAVLPSLIGWAALLPWLWGWDWPAGYLVAIGVLLAASPLVDRWLVRVVAMPGDWMTLRTRLSVGLGAMTVLLGVLAAA